MLIACMSWCNYQSVQAQVSFYAEPKYSGDKYEHADASKLMVNKLDFQKVIGSMKISNGYKLTVFALADYKGPSTIFYAGKYDQLPSFFKATLGNQKKASSIAKFRAGSYKLEHAPSHGLVELYYGKQVLNKLSGNVFKQELGIGSFDNPQLLGVPNVKGRRLAMNIMITSLSIPKGVVVKISNNSGKILTLANDHGKKYYHSYSIKEQKDFFGKVSKVEIVKTGYQIKNIELTLVEVKEFDAREVAVSHDNYSNETIDYHANEGIKETAYLHNFLQTYPYTAKTSASTSFSVKGGVLGPDNSKEHQKLFKEAAIKNISEAINSGHGHNEEVSYGLEEGCKGSCPPNSTCENIMTVESQHITFDYVATLVRLDANGKEVPNSAFTINSKITVDDTKSVKCVPGEVISRGGSTENKNTLSAGQSLKAGEKLVSLNGAYYLIMQQDGNFCVYKTEGNVFVWCMTGDGSRLKAGTVCTMQEDGNLNLAANGQWVWSVFHQANQLTAGSYLKLTDEGKAQIIAPNGEVKWQN